MVRNNHFTTRQRRNIQFVLNAMEELGEDDDFFAEAVEQFDDSNDWMCNRLLDIYNDWYEDRECMSLETALRLCAYEE